MSDNNCTFCKIIEGTIPAIKVLETDEVLAFHDVNPQAPVHVLVVPRVHVSGLMALDGASPMWNVLLAATQQVARQLGVGDSFRLVVNQGAGAGQSVFHLHLHVLGGRSFGWPPG